MTSSSRHRARLHDVAMLMLVFAATALKAQTLPPSPSTSYRIAGTVVSATSGQPLPRARVTITDAKTRRQDESVITADDGRFEFIELPAGKFALTGERKGFLTSAYDQHEQYSTAIVTGAQVDTEHLVLRLSPPAVLSGRVLDESGEPVRAAIVSVFREDRQTGIARIVRVRNSATDDRGTFEFPSLPAGTYFASATATPWYALHPPTSRPEATENFPSLVDRSLDVAYATAYYGDTTDSDEATPIPVRNADRLQVDIHLAPVPALHLLFRTPPKAAFNLPLLMARSFDATQSVATNNIQPISPGLFEIMGVPPGKYSVQSQESAQLSISDATEVNLTTNGQELEPPAASSGASLKVTVTLPGAERLPEHLGVVVRTKNERAATFHELDPQGEVQIQNLAPGEYNFYTTTRTKAYWVGRMSVQGTPVSGHTLNVPAGASLAVSLSLVPQAVTVDGIALRNGKGSAGAMIVLVPKDPESNRDLFRRDQSDLDGSFSLREVVPGTYIVVAIENGWDLDWSEPGVIAHYCTRGREVTVGAGPPDSMRLTDHVEVQPR